MKLWQAKAGGPGGVAGWLVDEGWTASSRADSATMPSNRAHPSRSCQLGFCQTRTDGFLPVPLVSCRVLEQVVQCKDDIAQQYLMQCLIMGFPDEFHLATLDQLLGALPQLQPGVKVHAVMGSLMERLAR